MKFLFAFVIPAVVITASLQADQNEGLVIRPLAERVEVPEESLLFTEIDADEAGLGDYVNDYSGPDVWTKRWREYILGTIGVGVSLGDVDGDRLPDLFVASKDEQSKLYRNLGNLHFADVTEASGLVDSPDPASGCSFVDVDNDGDLDLYLCFVNGRNQLWINDGAGRFSEEAEAWGVAIRSGCTMASFADFDRDGDLDFYLQNNMLNEWDAYQKLEDQLFENVGGRFEEITVPAGISGQGHGHSAVWWDYDEDGWPDIYVANDFYELDKLYRNNRDRTFTDVISQTLSQTPFYSMGSDFGDINNDGHSDFWVADMAATDRAQHLRTVGNHDHAYKFTTEGETHQSLKNALLLKLSADQFAEIAFLSGLARTDWTWAPRLVDLNNDGRLDAFASNGMLRSFHDSDRATLQKNYTGDDWMRVVFQNEPVLKERNLAFENLGDLLFEERGAAWGLDKLGVSFGAAFGDLDLDGDLDLVLNNFQEKLSVFRNNDLSGHRITIRLVGRESNRYGIGARVRVESGGLVQVKELALMRGYMSADAPVLHFGLGPRDRVDRLEVRWPSGRLQIFRDLPANVHFEIEEGTADSVSEPDVGPHPFFRPAAVQLPKEAQRSETYFSDFREQYLLPFPESRIGGSVALKDLNRDMRLDMVLGGSSGQETQVLLNRGDGVFDPILSLDFEDDFGCEDWDLQLVDCNGDGFPDLLAASGGVEMKPGDVFYEDRLYLNDGSGQFFREPGLPFADELFSTGTIAAADLDEDGQPEVFFGRRTIPRKYPLSGPSTLWRIEPDGWRRIDPETAPGLDESGRVTAADWADMDGDGDRDLVLMREWNTPVIWRNENGRLSPDPGAFSTGAPEGLWSSLAIVDLDGDGRLDIVAGNLGLNTEYRASAEEPIRIWYSDDDDGRVRLIETFVENGKEWLREVLARLEKVYPRQIRRIPSYARYAEMTFDEVFPQIREEGFRYVQATELRTGVFWQKGDGRFEFAPLPTFAQSGRAMAILVEDVDADGRGDIIVSLDSLSPEPWSGRIEKGHLGLFLNRGERHFDTVAAFDSGLSIDGSPRGLAWGDLDDDGAAELVVMLNEDSPVVFSLTSGAAE